MTEDNGDRKQNKLYQLSSSSVSEKHLHHHDNGQVQQQPQQSRQRALDAMWQSAAVTEHDAINNSNSKQQQTNAGESIQRSHSVATPLAAQ